VLVKFERLLRIINESGEKFIFLLDNIDKLSKSLEASKVKKFLDQLLEKCPNLQLILTCRNTSHQGESVLQLTGLLPAEAWHLFQNSYPTNISHQDCTNLAKTLPNLSHLPSPNKPPNYSTTALGQHHLFSLLQHNPHTIILTATLWHSFPTMSLSGLYHMTVEA